MNEIKCPNCGEVFTVNESQYAELLSQVKTAEFDKELHDRMKQELALAEQKAMNEQQTKLAQKDQEIAQLQSQIQKFDTEKELVKKEVEQTSHEALLAKDKDNKISERGSKGDFIFRDFDENGLEFISIMFEMKNEADGTEKKHKNSDFYKELDKDRREKNCEYAVLVTMLEADSDYFNTGIVDVSHEYEKMYVVRPQFFIQLIGLLRNAALNSLKYKQELALVREQNIDITHFEEDLDAFKLAFAKNYNSASTNFGKAIDEIDKAIKRMEEVKKFLTTSENQLRLANNKLEDVSVKKLTRKNPTMKAKFEALKGE